MGLTPLKADNRIEKTCLINQSSTTAALLLILGRGLENKNINNINLTLLTPKAVEL